MRIDINICWVASQHGYCTTTCPPSLLGSLMVAAFLQNPHTLLGKRFVCTPPPDEDDAEEYEGAWEVQSYSTQVREGRVDEEYVVAVESLGGASLPMGRDEVEFRLKHSTLVG
ncbi:hypothetical protein OH77DRAFT_1593981 [Trametes cingulata]|nr:hypothetical protein OH77DRAFT_1593981 [Trametes cingulata]